MLDLGLLELPGAASFNNQSGDLPQLPEHPCPGPEVSFAVCHFREIDLVMGLDWMVV